MGTIFIVVREAAAIYSRPFERVERNTHGLCILELSVYAPLTIHMVEDQQLLSTGNE